MWPAGDNDHQYNHIVGRETISSIDGTLKHKIFVGASLGLASGGGVLKFKVGQDCCGFCCWIESDFILDLIKSGGQLEASHSLWRQGKKEEQCPSGAKKVVKLLKRLHHFHLSSRNRSSGRSIQAFQTTHMSKKSVHSGNQAESKWFKLFSPESSHNWSSTFESKF